MLRSPRHSLDGAAGPFTEPRFVHDFRLKPRAVSAEGDRGECFRLTGAPKETITLSIEIDATDQLEQANPLATTMVIYPTLAALEMLLYRRVLFGNLTTPLIAALDPQATRSTEIEQ